MAEHVFNLPVGTVTVDLTDRAEALIAARAANTTVDEWLRGIVQMIQAKADNGRDQLVGEAYAAADAAGDPRPGGTRDEIADARLAER